MIETFQISKILYSIKHINDLYTKLSTKAAYECGITKAEADILVFLKNNPNCNTAKEIVKLKGFSKAYVSKAVEPLLNKGLIIVEIDKNDRRCQHLKVTEKANPLINKLHEMQIQFINKITDGISKEDIHKYLEVMELFSENSLR